LAGCCECGDEPSGSGAMEIVDCFLAFSARIYFFSFMFSFLQLVVKRNLVYLMSCYFLIKISFYKCTYAFLIHTLNKFVAPLLGI
jgi:hypothetical protein